MKNSTILLGFLLLGIILAAGCTGPLSPVVPVRETTSTAGLPTAVTVTTFPLPLPSPTGTFRPESSRVGEITTIATTRPAPDNPYLEYLNIRKRTFVNPLPDCLMENAFPAIAKDPGYGIQQVVPKLTALSEDEYETFLRKYTEGKAENTQLKTLSPCLGSEAEPTWNFIEVRAVLVPTNFYPSDYTITESVRFDGEIVARFVTTERLVIDEQLVLTRYVPLHADEVDLFDSVELAYTRL
jgi:hypothetical protein